MLKEDYLISITGKQDYDGETGEINVNTVGTYSIRNGVKYIAYKEYDEDSTISRTAVLKIEDNKMVTMSKAGSRTRIILEKGKRHSCLYETGYGQLQMGVFTSELTTDFDDNGGKASVSYTLDINSSLSSKNELFVEVKSNLNNN